MTYWVVSAGANGREYSDAFFDYGIAFLGGERPLTEHSKIQAGDTVILKQGLSSILAAGRVVDRGAGHSGCGDKIWLKDFDGWDLSGYFYVDWHVPQSPIPAQSMGLGIGTIYATDRPELRACADEILTNAPVRPVICEDPPAQKEVTDDQILKFLISQGLRPGAADDLTTTLARIRLLASYYYTECKWEDIREHETRTFLVIPLLLALGWSEQQIKIEYPVRGGRIDIACFAAPFKSQADKPPVLLIETKGFSTGLNDAGKQAKGYVAQFSGCHSVLITNGYCYKLFGRDDGDESGWKLTAYLNLLQPRERYPLDPTVDGALGVLSRLLPSTAIAGS